MPPEDDQHEPLGNVRSLTRLTHRRVKSGGEWPLSKTDHFSSHENCPRFSHTPRNRALPQAQPFSGRALLLFSFGLATPPRRKYSNPQLMSLARADITVNAAGKLAVSPPRRPPTLTSRTAFAGGHTAISNSRPATASSLPAIPSSLMALPSCRQATPISRTVIGHCWSVIPCSRARLRPPGTDITTAQTIKLQH